MRLKLNETPSYGKISSISLPCSSNNKNIRLNSAKFFDHIELIELEIAGNIIERLHPWTFPVLRERYNII